MLGNAPANQEILFNSYPKKKRNAIYFNFCNLSKKVEKKERKKKEEEDQRN